MPEFPSEIWWTPRQAALVKDRSRRWVEATFSQSDAVQVETSHRAILRKAASSEPSSGRVIPGGWEHEHCALCSRTISLHSSHVRTGFTDGTEWVCAECYGHYIAPRLRGS